MMQIEKVSVSRNDSIYELTPDVARIPNGKLVCIYRESDGHTVREFSRVVYRFSWDSGHTWSERGVLVDSQKNEEGVVLKWNCPRIKLLSDGRLVALCDVIPCPPDEGTDLRIAKVVLWFSEDEGETWSDPHETSVFGIVPDRLVELPSGAWFIATHVRMAGDEYIDISIDRGREAKLAEIGFRSEDGGVTWEGPTMVAQDPRYNLCEGSVLVLPNGELVCYLRENSYDIYPGFKAFSADDGRTWEGVFPTPMAGCHRPVSGLLSSGNVLVTYRYQQSGSSGGYLPHAQTASATWRKRMKGYFHHNTFAYLETVESAKARDLAEQGGRILPIDHDSSPRSDGGYTGWVVLHDGSIFCVNYINDDAPMAQIRGYWFREEDI